MRILDDEQRRTRLGQRFERIDAGFDDRETEIAGVAIGRRSVQQLAEPIARFGRDSTLLDQPKRKECCSADDFIRDDLDHLHPGRTRPARHLANEMRLADTGLTLKG